MNQSKPNPTLFRTDDTDDLQPLRMKAMRISVLVSILLLGAKFFTYWLTHSSAILSDALESIINVVAGIFAAISVWVAAKPPDPEHPYGHGKIEYFSAGFEGALIMAAAIGIFYSGLIHLISPHPLEVLEKGIALLFGATLINLLLGLYLIRTGRRTDSIVLIADGKHILTDVYSSVAVVVGLLLVYLTGWLQLDGAIACLVGINIVISGGKLVYQSFTRLMHASDPELLEKLTRLLSKHRRPDWVDIHQLRAWRAGAMVHIDLHLVLPESLTLEKAHSEANILEKVVIEEFNGKASVLVHMDPCKPDECPVCRRQNCDQRHGAQNDSANWNKDWLVRASTVARR
ncbi:MAG: cation diffusion facilitator family transporter [Desulfobacteraceae bacterium]|nr:cation diffusion facilitator family transporter [Desulfobacteraceae bacterium]